MNVVVWGQVKSENSSLPITVRVSKTRVLKLPIITSLAITADLLFLTLQIFYPPNLPVWTHCSGPLVNTTILCRFGCGFCRYRTDIQSILKFLNVLFNNCHNGVLFLQFCTCQNLAYIMTKYLCLCTNARLPGNQEKHINGFLKGGFAKANSW